MPVDKPTVAHLLPNYNAFPPVIPAGTELRVEQVGLRHVRYRPVVVCGAFPGQPLTEKIGGLSIRRIAFGRIYRRLFQKLTRLDPLPYGRRMWSILREERSVLLHIHNEPKLLAGLARYLGRERLPVVAHIANHKPFRREDLPLVDRFVACSRFMADWLTAEYGIAHERVEVIYTGVDVNVRPPWWEAGSDQRQALRLRHGIDENAVVFLFGGRLVREKGVAEMLDAFELVRQRLSRPVHLLVAGNVRESNDPNNEKTTYGRAMASRMQGMAGVTWVGSLKPSDMHGFLLSGDVFMLPSLWDDPFPTVMIEAAAAGLPIVAAARGGITEFLEDCPDHRFVARAEDPEAIAAVMADLAESDAKRLAIGRHLRSRIEANFDWTRVANQFEALYDRLLTGKP